MYLKRILSKIEFLYERYLRKLERSCFMQYNFIYKNYIKLVKSFKFSPIFPNQISWINTTLKSRKEIDLAVKLIKISRLNLHQSIIEKNWDSFIALNIILRNTDSSAQILDAGGQHDSLILSWLYQFGYNKLKCLNLIFKKRIKRGNIEFIPGNLTKTSFPNNFFDVITCISVIEHGVDEEKYFNEMNRILKRGGLLITSTDYWETKINTRNIIAYNNPVFVYDKDSIKNLLKKAFNNGFKLFGPEIELKCQDKVVNWEKFNLTFTFIIFCLQKK